MNNQYEIAVLYHPDLEVDLTKAEQKVANMVAAGGGKILSTDNWGKRKLAYTIAKQDYAVYVFYTVELPGTAIQKIEATLNITDEVIRYLISRPDLKAIAKAVAAKEEKAKKLAARGDRANDDSKDSDEDEE